jgi:cytochrome P450
MMTAIDFSNPAFKSNPYTAYVELREQQPLFRTIGADGMPVWFVTRYDDVMAVLKDPRFVKDYRSAMTPEQQAHIPPVSPAFQTLNESLLDLDPPDHTRLRTLVSQAFTPRTVEQLRPRIQAIADTLLDAVQERHEMDLIDAYAFPLPIMVITEMLGIPYADRDTFRRWSNTIVQGESFMQASAEEEATAEEFVAYLRKLIAERRARPQDDLVSGLVQAEDGGDTLSEDELIAMIFLLLVAGHETTVNLIGNGVLALLQHPDQLALLKRDPTLIILAVEEFLRYDGPVETSTSRFAREDVAIGDQVIPRGEMVLVVLGSANRDETQFTQPDDLDITRERNRHLAFGHGIHYCLGAPLARIEGQIAINTLLRRMPDLRLAIAPEQLVWRPGMLIRGPVALPVAW